MRPTVGNGPENWLATVIAACAFRLTPEEWAALRSQIATVAPVEHGALMAANILNSPRAVAMSVYVISKNLSKRCATTMPPSAWAWTWRSAPIP
ncbi:MAG: hypothetical protein ACLQU3_09105 [Limisphaerales bacterium]